MQDELLLISSTVSENQIIAGTPQKIVDPVDSSLIVSELDHIRKDCLLYSLNNFSVYCSKSDSIPNLLREIGRLREITFREVGEGTNRNIDLDEFDRYYYHLVVWDNLSRQVVGAYRLGKGRDILENIGSGGFYINSLFRIDQGFDAVLEKSLELGRTFIVRKYQRHPFSLAMLWKGILMVLLKNRDYQYLIGPVSISNKFTFESKSLVVQYIMQDHFDYLSACRIAPRNEFNIPEHLYEINKSIIGSFSNGLKSLEFYLRSSQKEIVFPVLLRKYLEMSAKVIGFNIDPDFNFCLDALMLARISEMPQAMLATLVRDIDTDHLRNIAGNNSCII
jgi:putative hemolysin